MPTTQELLRQVSFFAHLDEKMLALLADCTRLRRFAARQALFHAGDPGRTLYLTVSGVVAIQKPTALGPAVHLAQRGPGEHFGELALIDGRPRMADAVAVTDCEVLLLDREEFVQCLTACPSIVLAVMASLAERLREAGDALEGFRTQSVLGRLAGALLSLAEASGAEVSPSGMLSLELTMSRQEMADRIGTTRESVSRALSHLRRLKAVQSEGRSLLILDPAKLRRYCSP